MFWYHLPWITGCTQVEKKKHPAATQNSRQFSPVLKLNPL